MSVKFWYFNKVRALSVVTLLPSILPCKESQNVTFVFMSTFQMPALSLDVPGGLFYHSTVKFLKSPPTRGVAKKRQFEITSGS